MKNIKKIEKASEIMLEMKEKFKELSDLFNNLSEEEKYLVGGAVYGFVCPQTAKGKTRSLGAEVYIDGILSVLSMYRTHEDLPQN